jgi:hypothetical protein
MVSQIMNRAVIEGGIPELTRDRSGSIGAILVEQGRLSPAEVEEIQQFAVKNRLRFGDAALRTSTKRLLSSSNIQFFPEAASTESPTMSLRRICRKAR